ncbi:hypothetical protein F5Y19DRAFT_437905 [Xylariaceae sp. FL1651]|nr:hypothetical protein F5Y19DRAFT_437905 [Xylariaceae sp. FL1651]
MDPVRTRKQLAQAFVDMSQIYRDLVIDFSITPLNPKDVLILRNLIQAVIRALLSLKTETRLFDPLTGETSDHVGSSQPELTDFIIDIDKETRISDEAEEKETLQLVIKNLATPAENLLQSMKLTLQSCDATLMDVCRHRRCLGPPYEISNDVRSALANLRKDTTAFKNRQDYVLESDKLPHAYHKFPEVVKVFAFCRPVQQAAVAIESLAIKVIEIQQRQSKYPKLYLPSYPFWKALHRTNAQVRHDQGDVTAGSYFRSFSDIAKIVTKIRSRDFQPIPQKGGTVTEDHDTTVATMTADELSHDPSLGKNHWHHRTWTLLHRMQGFETRFGLKTALVTSLLAIPAYLTNSDSWWDEYEVWWAVVMGWLIMGPRTGGNVQDLFARACCALLGSLWAGLSYAAGKGNPYVVAVFAAIFMPPMMYRYTQSTHPRSGMVGCMSFTVVSLSEVIVEGKPSVAKVAATRGASIIVGVVASVMVNWVLWPFVARHDLRKGMASMIFYCSIIYRGIVSKYALYDEGHAPTEEEIKASEILEGRLREGFVRLRQLMGLTRHELRLRAPFDPLPYSALIDASEGFFEHIVTVRQSSLFYHPHFIRDNSEAAMDMLGYRRDAIATIMTDLYVLSGALLAKRQVPKYLPNAAFTRKRLLDRMEELEREHAANEIDSKEEKRRQIYRYLHNESLTGCVRQLNQLEQYTKVIVGEQGFS